jgi:hypothetical protein
MTNASYMWPFRSHVRQPSAKSLLGRNRAPALRMKSWLPAIVRPDCHPGLPHSPSNKPPCSREVRLDNVVTKLLGLPGPINSTYGQYNSKLLHRGQNDAVLNRHRRGLSPWNLRISMTRSPPLPFECSPFPYLPRLVTQQA